ncbi:MAG: hypothetical protein JO356_11210 [Acidobacteria bacterium]|nr:hypothetical protein [Acidobacteriota bacterium]
MTWADFYFVCFAVGFFLSLLTFLTGGLRLNLPHLHLSIGHAHPGAAHGGAGSNADHIGPFSLITLTAFLAWFGGTGYLLARHSTMWFFTVLLVSLLSGTGGAAIVYLFLSRVLSSPDAELDSADFEMAGVLGRLSVRIREGGTGELIYSQAGTRRVCAARSEDGRPIVKGAEVVVTRYERGVAYVRPWAELSGEDKDLGPADKPNSEKEARTP